MTDGRRRPSRWLLAMAFLGALPFAGRAEVWIPLDIPSARTSALGGPHVALADDLSTLFSNPAGFRSAGPQLSISELTFRLSGPIFDIANIFSESLGKSFDDILSDSDVQDLIKSIYAGSSIVGPLAFGYVGNGLGFGFFNNTDMVFEGRGSVPQVTTHIQEKLFISGGYSFRLPVPESWNGTLDAGVLLKAFMISQSSTTQDIINLVDSFSDPYGLVMYEPFDLTLGIGIDLGFLYTIDKRISLGLVGRNLPTPVIINHYPTMKAFMDSEEPDRENEFLPFDLSLGVMFRPRIPALERYLTDLKLLFDYSDIFDFWTHPDTSTNPVLHLGLGAEVELLQILAVRLGFYQGLPAAGFGLNLTAFRLNLAMFGTELSPEPGLRSVFNMTIGLEFRY